jgi:glycosyltransferase involved in cell wall biosynthesis
LCAEGTVLPSGVTLAPIRRYSTHPRIVHVEHLVRLPWEVGRARARTRSEGSVFHNPVFHAPAGIAAPWVQTLHDVIPLARYSPDMAVLTKRWKRFGPRYLKAAAVIAISQHAASEGIKYLGLEPSRIHVAHHGVDPAFTPGAGPSSDPPYILMVNEFSRRKGYGEAFAVFDALVDAGYPHRLVVVGRVQDYMRQEFETLLGGARHRERIDVRQWVPELLPIYQSASAFLMTSRYEGFGLTPLEAMACGVPVIAFSNSSVTEVVEGGGQLVPDGDVAAVVTAVRRVLDDPACAQEWRERGIVRASAFTWAASAAIHAEVYRSVAEAAG